jgi:hypothetical protein
LSSMKVAEVGFVAVADGDWSEIGCCAILSTRARDRLASASRRRFPPGWLAAVILHQLLLHAHQLVDRLRSCAPGYGWCGPGRRSERVIAWRIHQVA